MKKNFKHATGATLFFLFVLLSPVLSQEAKSLHAPDALPGVEPEMLTAAYWIALQPDAGHRDDAGGYARGRA